MGQQLNQPWSGSSQRNANASHCPLSGNRSRESEENVLIQTLGPHGQLHSAAAFRADADSSANTGAKQDVPGRKFIDYKCYVVS